MIAWTVIVLVEFANPHAGSLAHSLAGARQHLEFVPLFFLAYAFVRTTRALRTFCVLLAVIAAANGVAGWVQFNESPAQFAAWGPGYSERVLGTGAFAGAGRSAAVGANGSATRPFGLGSDAGDGGLFAMLALCGILALAAFSRRRRYQLFAVAMALLAVVAVITSQGRSVVVGSVLTVLAFAALTLKAGNRLKSGSGFAIMALAIALVVAAVVSAGGNDGLRYQGLAPSGIVDTTASARGLSITAIPHNLVTYPFGAGVGTAGPASGSPGASNLTELGALNAETEFSFLVIETGIPGMVVLTGFLLAILYIGVTRVRDEPDREARVLLSALIAPLVAMFAQFFISALTPSVPLGPYLFVAGGIISYWLVELPRQRRAQELGTAATTGGALGAPATVAIAAPSSVA
jgi:hypothetical protein